MGLPVLKNVKTTCNKLLHFYSHAVMPTLGLLFTLYYKSPRIFFSSVDKHSPVLF